MSKLEIPQEIADRITSVEENHIDITLDDIDRNKCDEDNLELAEILIDWNNLPFIYDNFESHADRRSWKTALEKKHGADSVAARFLEGNKLKADKMNAPLNALPHLLGLEVFTDEERERISAKTEELRNTLSVNNHILTGEIRTVEDIMAVFREQGVPFDEELVSAESPEEFILDQNLAMISRLEAITSEVLEKLVDKEKIEDRRMKAAAERAAANASGLLPSNHVSVNSEAGDDFNEMIIAPFGSELLAAGMEIVQKFRDLLRKITGI